MRLAIIGGLLVARARALRLVTFNIHGWRTAEHEDNLRQLIELLRSLEPDVLCLTSSDREELKEFVARACLCVLGRPTRARYAERRLSGARSHRVLAGRRACATRCARSA